jgi:hypothetical protein
MGFMIKLWDCEYHLRRGGETEIPESVFCYKKGLKIMDLMVDFFYDSGVKDGGNGAW